jgi:hypothetical protein
MSKSRLRLVKDLQTGIKSLFIESNKMNQKRGIGTAFFLSLLLFSVLSSISQFDLFRVDAIMQNISSNSLVDGSRAYNQNKLESHPLVNLSSPNVPIQSALEDSLHKWLSGRQTTSLAFNGSEIGKNVNANTITAGNIANVTDKNTASLVNASTITAGNIANVTDKNTASLVNASTITAGNFANNTREA